MATDTRTTPEPTLSGLVSGILRDAQELIQQEIALARVEIRDEVRKTRDAALSMAAGLVCVALGAIFFLLLVVFIITWATSQHIPLWGSFGIVGAVLCLVGAILVYNGRNRAEQIHLIPKQTAETMRENMQWIRNPR
jgi:uncharacterized membrane protein YqjE